MSPSPDRPEFLIVVAARGRPELFDRCLASINAQTYDKFRVAIADDASEPALADPHHGTFVRRERRVGALRNQVDLVRLVDQRASDVIVFVDGDDRLAHPNVLHVLANAYGDDTLVTYGSYRAEPADEGCRPAEPYPAKVIRQGTFRRAGHSFNHLRTMRRRVFDAIHDDDLKIAGEWPTVGGDYALMMPALELAAPRIKVLPDVLYVYTSDRDDSDWRVHAAELNGVHRAVQRKRPRRPLN